jgi:hypothetical protein
MRWSSGYCCNKHTTCGVSADPVRELQSIDLFRIKISQPGSTQQERTTIEQQVRYAAPIWSAIQVEPHE